MLTRAITVEEVPSLNWKELQDALYYGHDLNDQPATCKQGADLIRAVYEEYERRGLKSWSRRSSEGSEAAAGARGEFSALFLGRKRCGQHHCPTASSNWSTACT